MSRRLLFIMAGLVLACVLTACERPDPGHLQGYVEGEFVYVASPLGGQLQTLSVITH